jgi:hypothetical protein
MVGPIAGAKVTDSAKIASPIAGPFRFSRTDSYATGNANQDRQQSEITKEETPENDPSSP